MLFHVEPKAFEVKKSDKPLTEAVDPFSTDRQYNLPSSEPLDIQKSSKTVTQFVEVKASGQKPQVSWTVRKLHTGFIAATLL